MIRTKLIFWISEGQINEWFKSKNIFFILALGRSGTKFLANLLNKASGVYVAHEPVKEDFQAYQEAFWSEEKARDYIQSFRKKEIYLRARKRNIHTYGEVNGVLRRHCLALKEAFPEANFLHLIRDGRAVVRSMMSRKTMTADDPHTASIFPQEDDPWFEKWPKMSRFERLCWYWQAENRYLRTNIQKTIQLEKVVASYEYFKENVLELLGLKISKKVWQDFASSPQNKTKRYQLPHWSEWDQEMRKKFRLICQEEMEKNGYEAK